MKELTIDMTATEWMTIGAAAAKLGVSLEELTRRAVRSFSESTLAAAAANPEEK